ncbi:hypothetical protein [Clostridium sp. SM-530-WT-3G]|uniref:hypothetical protein n=1 Tax=Clostridium sp. SM-530-WT-3G TaxID=2725303 RepID=UPI00145EE395|nr:hypothetical protein [Clostridium sp. SM-530-WT-3G]NME83178.1 hypothetical protein [Clostridium sp. SM-530-WT-3G]
MQNKDKPNIIDAYSQTQQGPLVGRGNDVLARAENIKDNNEDFTDSLATPSIEDVQHGKTYGKKEYHGI